MAEKQHLYWDWVKAEAKKINSDGCTLVSQIFKDCCLEHDLGYWYAKDPRSAYRFYRDVVGANYWYFADTLSRNEVDKRFRNCIQRKSKLGKASPIGWVRWLGVRAGGWKPWGNHRKKGHNAASE